MPRLPFVVFAHVEEEGALLDQLPCFGRFHLARWSSRPHVRARRLLLLRAPATASRTLARFSGVSYFSRACWISFCPRSLRAKVTAAPRRPSLRSLIPYSSPDQRPLNVGSRLSTKAFAASRGSAVVPVWTWWVTSRSEHSASSPFTARLRFSFI